MSKLVPIRPSHEVITFSPPLTAAPRLAMDRIEASLHQRGMAVRRAAPDRLEFDCSAWWKVLNGDTVSRAAMIVRGGTIVLDPVDPHRRMHLELRYSPLMPLVMAAVACFFVLMWEEPIERVFGLLGLVSIALFSWWSARDTIETWISEAAEGAGRP